MLPAWITRGVRGYVRRFGPGRDGAVPGAGPVPDAAKFLNEEGAWVAAGGGGTPATTVTDETTWGVAPAVGADTSYARQGHTHGTPPAPTAGSVGADPAGSAAAAIGAAAAYTDAEVAAEAAARIAADALALPKAVLTAEEDFVILRGGVPTALHLGPPGSVPMSVGGLVVWTALSLALYVSTCPGATVDVNSAPLERST